MLESHKPMGAYDVLGQLARAGKRPAPPTVYRALDFLTRAGFVHRIDSLSAFVACFAPAKAHRSHFLLCRACGRAAEIEDTALDAALAQRRALGRLRAGARDGRDHGHVPGMRKLRFLKAREGVIASPLHEPGFP